MRQEGLQLSFTMDITFQIEQFQFQFSHQGRIQKLEIKED